MKTFRFILSLATIALLTACSSTSKLDRSVVPAAGPAPKIQLGDYQVFNMDNGMKVIVVENHKLPRVSYSISLDNDPILEGEKAGYVSMAGDLLRSGTTSRSKEEIDEAVDFIGARIGSSASGIYGSSLTKHSDTLLTLMSDILLNPTYPEAELAKSKAQAISGLVSAKTNADVISGNIGRAMAYGLDHPYGEKQTEENIENIQREDLLNYYNTYFRPNVAYLVIVGDINLEQAKIQAQKYFGSWERQDVPTHTYATPVAPEVNKVAFVDVPGSVQSVIDLTYPVDLKPGTPDNIPANVMNAVLGGGVFSGRLMQNLREDKAYTYGARSSLSSDDLIGNFSAGASVRNEVTDSAIVQILFEMDRMTKETVADSTIQFVKNSMAGSFARSLESPQTIARFALNIERYGLPADYYANYLTRLDSVSAEDVMAAAKKYILPNNAYITVVGSKSEVADKLARFDGSGEVGFYNMYGEVDLGYAEAPEGVSAQTVIDQYIVAVGGAEKVHSVKSFTKKGTMQMGPMSMDVEIKAKDNQKYFMSFSMNGQVMMEQKINGAKGSVSQMGQTMPVEGPDAEIMRMEAYPVLEAEYQALGFQTSLLGLSEIDGQEVYVITTSLPNGSMQTDYYNVKTGLKVQSVQIQETPQGNMSITSTYDEYQEFGGLKFPTSINQMVGQQQMKMNISSITVNENIKDSDFDLE